MVGQIQLNVHCCIILVRHELSLQNNCILWGTRTVVPNQGQASLLSELHSGNVGMTRMKELAEVISGGQVWKLI